MTIAELLESLTDAERNFISGLDHGDDVAEHRAQLDLVIQNLGAIDAEEQLWYPYSVIEIGKNTLQAGHEREYAACMAITLHNVILGNDKMNNVAQIVAINAPQISTLPVELKDLVNGFVQVKDDMITTRRVQLRAYATGAQPVHPEANASDVGAPDVGAPDVSAPDVSAPDVGPPQ